MQEMRIEESHKRGEMPQVQEQEPQAEE